MKILERLDLQKLMLYDKRKANYYVGEPSGTKLYMQNTGVPARPRCPLQATTSVNYRPNVIVGGDFTSQYGIGDRPVIEIPTHARVQPNLMSRMDTVMNTRRQHRFSNVMQPTALVISLESLANPTITTTGQVGHLPLVA